jgi:hypothetical protein
MSFGKVIAYLTFPGVIVHELAHATMCKLCGVRIHEICYFQLIRGDVGSVGYVLHDRPKHFWQQVLISFAPLAINTLAGAVIAMPSAMAVTAFWEGSAVDWVLMWLGVSIAMHSFPSTGDAASIWQAIWEKEVPWTSKLVAVPLVVVIYAGSLASFLWLDVVYGVVVATLLPWWIAYLLA